MKLTRQYQAKPDLLRPFVSNSFKMRLFDIRHSSRDADYTPKLIRNLFIPQQ
jgi:hypothetical protein